MTTPTLDDLLTTQTKAEIYADALEVAEAVNLPVSTWEQGDPTRSTYHLLAEYLETHDQVSAQYIGAGFLDHAPDDWLPLLAWQVYGVETVEATFASGEVTLTNTGGGLYEIEAGDITFRSSATDKTYRNTSGGTLSPGPGTTLVLEVAADEAGSASSAAAGEIDELVTTLLGVTVSNAAALVGLDAETPASIRQRCRDKLASLSPNGPRGAYSYVARDPDLSGTTAVTRTREFGDSDTGDVLVYLAGPSGAVASEDRDLVEAAILEWALPLCITPTVASATNVPVAVTYSLWIYSGVNLTSAEIEDAIEEALADMLATRPIGGDIIPPAVTGAVYKDWLLAAIERAFPNHTFRATLTLPASDVALTNSQVATLGTVTPTITFVEDP